MDKSVTELNARVERQWNETVSLYNPTSKDFSYQYGDTTYTALAMDMVEVPLLIAPVIKKHLAEHVLNVRGLPHKLRDQAIKEVEMK